jgi:methyl-accepting chemotaxis protein
MHHDQDGFDAAERAERLNKVAAGASTLGAEIVDIDGFLGSLENKTKEQLRVLQRLREGAGHVVQMNASVMETLTSISETITNTLSELTLSKEKLDITETHAHKLVDWVQSIDSRTQAVQSTLDAVQGSNNQIAVIAAQVNMLAINAKIEAARAGESGKGFAVVADAINELSHRTGKAAEEITSNVTTLIDWIEGLQKESSDFSGHALQMREKGDESHRTLVGALSNMEATAHRTELIAKDAAEADGALQDFLPNISDIDTSVRDGVDGVVKAHHRVAQLIDTSETLVQNSVALGGNSQDQGFIDEVQSRARAVTRAFAEALEQGQADLADFFDSNYKPVPGSNPKQVTTRFTRLTDRLLPDIIEPALDFDTRVVFCAAVDRNGYLPTHNRKFSQTPTDDPVWNTANCRNRRIFDDRVGLKAGRNTEPFLLQVYRRDMGGGKFILMKDVSAPITIDGRHWGGLRLAYSL